MSNDDFEALLRATLTERAEQAPDSDQLSRRVLADIDVRAAEAPGDRFTVTDPLVARGAARARQRRLGRLLVPLASAATVAAVVGLGLVITHADTSSQKSSSRAVSAGSAAAADNPAQRSTPASAAGASPGGNRGTTAGGVQTSVPSTTVPSVAGTSSTVLGVPAGFQIVDLSFDSSDTGFALGTTPCTAGSCPTLARLQPDGTWRLISDALPFAVAASGSAGGAVAVTDVRFATASVGYAFGPSVLFITDNGGVDWTQQVASAAALEVADSTVLRVSDDDCTATCTFTVSDAAVGTGTFSPVAIAGAPLTGTGVKLARAGANAFLAVTTADGTGQTFISSANDGQTWTRRADNPCVTASNSETSSQVSSLAAASDGSVTALCTSTASQFVVTSTDGGAHFTPGAVITTGQVSVVASASATTLVTAGTRIYRSVDSGQHWAVVPGITPAASTRFLGFQDALTGRWVGASAGSVWTTTDGGATWAEHSFG